MIEELGSILDAFPGAANQTRCFLHILNLVAKSVLHQFEPPKARDKDLLSEGAKELAALAEDLEESLDDHNGEDNDLDELEDDNKGGEQDEREGMSEEEIVELEECVQPVRFYAIGGQKLFNFQTPNSTCHQLSFHRCNFTLTNATSPWPTQLHSHRCSFNIDNAISIWAMQLQLPHSNFNFVK